MVEIETRYGRFALLENDQIISKSLRIYGEWAQDEIDILSEFIERGQTVLDVGAFIGTHSRAFSAMVGESGRVISFEPRQDTLTVLAKNVEFAQYKNIFVHPVGLGRAEESRHIAHISEESANNFGGFSIEPLAESANTPFDAIEVRKIDSYASDLSSVDFIKIDVEGMETDVLIGATEIIERYKPSIFTECNTAESGLAVLQFCKDHCYSAYGVLTRAFNPENFNKTSENIFSNAAEIGLLLIAKSRNSALSDRLSRCMLREITTADELVLLLLHKPQYPYEVLEPLTATIGLDINYPSALADNYFFALTSERKKLACALAEIVLNEKNASESASSLPKSEDLLRHSIASVEELTVKRRKSTLYGKQLMASFDALTANSEKDRQLIARLLEDIVVTLNTEATTAAALNAERKHNTVLVSQFTKSIESEAQLRLHVLQAECKVSEMAAELSASRDKEQASQARVAALQTAVENAQVRLTDLSTNLERTISEKRSAQQVQDEIKAQLNDMREEISRILNSKSWIATKPVRWARRVFRGEFEQAVDPFKRMYANRRKALTASGQAKGRHASNPSPPEIRARSITVILPIYRGVEMTLSCINHALPAILKTPGTKFFLINDCSPDVDMQMMIESVAEKYPGVIFTYRNMTNLGFVGTVNEGLSRFTDDDIVLLNSDVIVPSTWLPRLAAEAYSCGHVATVTPFSNNATICSFPIINAENAQPFGLDVNTIDSVFAERKMPCIESPTGIGFCMYIRRDCLNEIGYLNTERFGRGYGEENDLCQRALKAGWFNLLSPNLYAYHEGGVSFSTDKLALIERAMKVLDEMHSNYHADVHSFIAHDPMKPARIARYIRLLAKLPAPKVLHISHGKGGGVVQHIEELATFYGAKLACLVLNPVAGNGVKLHLSTEPFADTINFKLPDDFQALQDMLRAATVSAVHFHHSIELNRCIFDLPKLIGAKKIVTVHDFYWINGNPTLTNKQGLYLQDQVDDIVNPLYELPAEYTPASWRESFGAFLSDAEVVIFPSDSTKQIFGKYFNLTNTVVAPHTEAGRDISVRPVLFTSSAMITIGVLGALGREKGADVLESLATMAMRDNAPFKFKLIGYAYRDLQNVEITGSYTSSFLSDLIVTNELDVILFPARWPETFSYTLSYALESSRPIFAPRIGAFIERLDARPYAALFDHDDSNEAIYAGLCNFIRAIQCGQIIYCDKYFGDKGDGDFYADRYIMLAEQSDASISAGESISLESIIGNLVLKGIPFRENFLQALCNINANKKFTWVRNMTPISVRRKVRRLIAGPFHK